MFQLPPPPSTRSNCPGLRRSDHGVTLDEMQTIKTHYINAAERAQRAGFDGVECHSANGYFLLSFLSRIWNFRTDQYGPQSMENRTRLHSEIIAGIRERCGKDFVIGVRINGMDFGHPNAMTPEEGAEAAKLLEGAGADYISVTGYGYGRPAMQYVPDYWAYPEPDEFMKPYLRSFKTGLTLPGAEAVKKAVRIPVAAVGRLDEKLGEETLRHGRADMILLGRALWADHDLPNKLVEGREDDILHCCHCATCEDPQEAPRRCRVNPALGREKELAILPAQTKKRVLVVGGGPAGMEAARVAALRGHDVTLCERGPSLGGKMHLSVMVKGIQFDDVTGVIDYLTRQVTQLPITVKCNTEVDEALIDELKPDVVIFAVGGAYSLPEQVPGIHGSNVVGVPALAKMAEVPLRMFGAKALSKLSEIALPGIGEKCGRAWGPNRGLQGAIFLESAEERSRCWRRATPPARGCHPVFSGVPSLGSRRKEWTSITEVHYDEVTASGVRITTKEGDQRLIPADTVMVLLPPFRTGNFSTPSHRRSPRHTASAAATASRSSDPHPESIPHVCAVD